METDKRLQIDFRGKTGPVIYALPHDIQILLFNIFVRLFK